MSLASVSRMEAELLLSTYERQPILFVRGRGVHLWDSEGKRYLDFLSGIGVNALGHNHPAIQTTIKRQAGRLIHISNLFFHEYQAELARLLTEMSGLDRAFFCNSGTEAWEGALKLARAFAQMNNRNGSKPKTSILAMDNSFHGRTFGALATTGQSAVVRIRPLSSKTRWWSSGTSSVCASTAPSMPSGLNREPRSDSAFTPRRPGLASGLRASHGAPPPFARGWPGPSLQRSGRRGRGQSAHGHARSRSGQRRP